MTVIYILSVLLLITVISTILLDIRQRKLFGDLKSFQVRNKHLTYEIYCLQTELNKYKEMEAANEESAASYNKKQIDKAAHRAC